MKLVLFEPTNIKNIHIKIIMALQLMCKARSIQLEFSTQVERLQLNDYEIVYAVNSFIEPTTLPSTVKILFGPQMGTFSFPGITGVFREELVGRCVYNALSEWVIKMREEFAPSSIPVVCFPFAIDTKQFEPKEKPKDLDCLVYIKHREPHFIEKALKIIQDSGVSYETITYANYYESDYMALLERCNFMICLDANETQGFALEEAMACDVPLLVCDVKSMYEEYYDTVQPHGHLAPTKNLFATSVPYWSDECGIRIYSLDELPKAIETMKENEFHPRPYILETLSPGVCMDRILNYFGLSPKLTRSSFS